MTVANLQQAKRSSDLDRESLLKAYDEVCEDRKAVDREAEVLRAFQDGAAHKIKILQEKVVELQERVNSTTLLYYNVFLFYLPYCACCIGKHPCGSRANSEPPDRAHCSTESRG